MPHAAPRTIAAKPLTAKDFAAFGTVATAGAAAEILRQGEALAWAEDRAQLKVVLSQVAAVPQPYDVPFLECHPLSFQLFAPLGASRFLVVVAPGTPEYGPAFDHVAAFVGDPGQAFCYRPGVWHCPFGVLDRDAPTLMMMAESRGPDDCWKRPLPAPLTVAV